MGKLIFAGVVLVLVILYFINTKKNKALALENIELGKSFLAQNLNQPGVLSTPSGLQYLVLTQGNGTIHPRATDRVKVHYHGTLLDGTVFDSSVERNEPLTFGLNQVIKGWTEGVQLMVLGEKTRFFIPSNLGYGNSSAGKIAPGSLLIFDVELLAINE